MAIRYGKDGSIETYDVTTGKKTGEIHTMGNFMDATKEDEERHRKQYEEAMAKYGMEPYPPDNKQ